MNSNKAQSQLWVVLGSGGVGKTTSSAALAYAAAESGKKVAVITVDPAKRLAQVLGLQALSNEPQTVAEFPNGGKLSALWLDTSGALVDLIKKHGERIPSIEKIIEHRLFKIIQSQLGGIEEYLGVEKVVSLGSSGNYDLCILDTPPSRHALDFLESPRHLLKFFDEGVLRIFLSGDSEKEKGFFSKVLSQGKDQVLDVFKNFLGQRFLGELAELLMALKPVHKIFTETALSIEEWVRRPSTQFILVSLLEPYPMDEARLLKIELSAKGLAKPSLLILNKALPDKPLPMPQIQSLIGAEPAQLLFELQKTQNLLRSYAAQDTSVEVKRYSVQNLSKEHLRNMGQGILSTWLSKNPKIFS